MNEQEFFDRLRNDAAGLRYEGDDFMAARVATRVRERISAPESVSLFLARWLRPIAASLSAVTLAAFVSVALLDRSSIADSSSLESLTSQSSSVEIAMDGDIYSVE